MAKRKRESGEDSLSVLGSHKKTFPLPRAGRAKDTVLQETESITVQIIAGSYDRILHGLTATIPSSPPTPKSSPLEVHFEDTFLFNAHTSAIRCLALSPLPSPGDTTQSQKIILASGSTDERINLYHISASAPSGSQIGRPSLLSLGAAHVKENPKNKELGSLLHHASSITALYFPTRSKLLSAAEDNTIAISRTRDWTILSTIKAPIPKAIGRPSGDTAPLGGTPAGVNDFAVHPSMKLMISVGKGEKCMRLWDLVRGKKAGVLTFEREILQGIGEGKWASGEGRKVEWNGNGDEFVVGFEKGAVIFGMDSTPKCRVMPSPSTKIHQIRYVLPRIRNGQISDLLAVSTEDGRVLFYSTKITETVDPPSMDVKSSIPICTPLGQLGGKDTGMNLRIKDFEVLECSFTKGIEPSHIVVTGSSDGSLRIWTLQKADLNPHSVSVTGSKGQRVDDEARADEDAKLSNGLRKTMAPQIGTLLGTHETGNRITCVKAFVMLKPTEAGNAAQNQQSTNDSNGIDSDRKSNSS